MKFLDDTLKIKGRYSQKRIMTFTSFFVATFYAFAPLFFIKFDVKDFVFLGFIGAGGFSLYNTRKEKENITE